MINKPPRHTFTLFLLTALLAVSAACSQGKIAPPQERETAEAPEAQPLDVGSATEAEMPPDHPDVAAGEMPPGHPPIGAATAGSGPVTWVVPDAWVEEAPRNSMRKAQYRVPGPGGDGECVVFYFGPGQGGDVQANINRWANQFEQPDGTPSTERVQVRELEGGAMPMWIAEVTGTYNGGMTMTDQPSPKQPNAMLLGGIVQGPEAPWFFKFTGPEETVRANEQAFVGLMESVRAGG